MTLVSSETLNEFANVPFEKQGQDIASRLTTAKNINSTGLSDATAIKASFQQEVSRMEMAIGIYLSAIVF